MTTRANSIQGVKDFMTTRDGLAATAGPGAGAPGTSFASWVGLSGLPLADRDPDDDPDSDGRSNFVEYALGSSASTRDAAPPFEMDFGGGWVIFNYEFRTDRPGAVVAIEHSGDLGSWQKLDSTSMSITGGLQQRHAEQSMIGRQKGFYRLSVTESAP